MFPATVRTLLHKDCEGESPSRGILLEDGEVLEGLLVERALRGIGCNQDGLHELVEFLLHGGRKGGLCRQTLDTAGRWV